MLKDLFLSKEEFKNSVRPALGKIHSHYGQECIGLLDLLVQGDIKDLNGLIIGTWSDTAPHGYKRAGIKQLLQLLEMGIPPEWKGLELYSDEAFTEWNIRDTFLIHTNGHYGISRTFQGNFFWGNPLSEHSVSLRDNYRCVFMPA